MTDVDAVTPLAVTPGVTHFGAYHRPPDSHYLKSTHYSFSEDICHLWHLTAGKNEDESTFDFCDN